MIDVSDLVLKMMTRLVERHDAGQAGRISMTEKLMKPYHSRQIKLVRDLHQLLEELSVEGLIELQWLQPGISLQLVRARDPERIAEKFNIIRHQEQLSYATQQLDTLAGNIPSCQKYRDAILQSWKNRKTWAGFNVDQAASLSEALTAADWLLKQAAEGGLMEEDIRHASSQIYNDSKRLGRIEGAVAKVVKMMDADIDSSLTPEEVLQLFGVTRIAHPTYLSGPIRLYSKTGGKALSADMPPSIGIWANQVDFIRPLDLVSRVTTIENLASFNRYIAKEKAFDEVVLYTAGIPTPAFKWLYHEIAKSLPSATLRHWGDVDLGGFIILGMLEKAAPRPVSAFRMDKDSYLTSQSTEHLKEAEKRKLSTLKLSPDNWVLASQCAERGLKFEQEAYGNMMPGS